MPTCVIYKCRNTINGKTYIGFDSNWPNRKKAHLYMDRECIFHRALRKYGPENFSWEVLFESDDWDTTLNTIEPFYIKLFGSFGKHGYNMTAGGDAVMGNGKSHNEESKNKMAEAKKAKPTKYWSGKERDQETKEKISNTKKGTIQTEEHKKLNSNKIKELWNDPVWRKNMLESRRKKKELKNVSDVSVSKQ